MDALCGPLPNLGSYPRDCTRSKPNRRREALFLTIAGDGREQMAGDGGSALDATLAWVQGIAIDPAGNIYLACSDGGYSVIRKINKATEVIETIAGSYDLEPGYAGDGGQAVGATLYQPMGIALDAAGNLYIADTYNNVIRMVSASSGIITTVAGNGTAGYSGDNGPAARASLNLPAGVAVDSLGNLYIADTYNHVIRKVATGSQIISTIAGNGTAGYYEGSSAASMAALRSPTSVIVAPSDDVYVTDTGNACIRRISSSGGIETVAGNRTIGSSGDGGLASNAAMMQPWGVVANSANILFVSDMDANVVRAVGIVGGSKLVVTLNVSSNSVLYGTAVNFAASVPTGATGTIEFKDGTNSLGIATVANGNASLVLSTLAVGSHSITAVYSGDNGFAASTSSPVILTVSIAMSVVCSPSRLSVGSKVQITATLLGGTKPSGQIVFSVNGNPLGGADVVSGVARWSANSMNWVPGTYSITAAYGGDAVNGTANASTSATVSATIDMGTVTLTVNGAIAATASYGGNSTPASIAAGLASNVTSQSPVTIRSINDALFLESKASGAITNYSYRLESTSYDSTSFSYPSFAYPALSGNLAGGADQGSAQGSNIYEFSVPDGGYDAKGNIVNYVDSVNGSWFLEYDALDRLKAGVSNQAREHYYCWSYDSFGNRTSQIASSAAIATGEDECTVSPDSSVTIQWAGYNTKNQLINSNQAVGGIIYDQSGNITYDGNNEYLYDADGRLCALARYLISGDVMMTGYVYDAFGRRVAKGTISNLSCDPGSNGFMAENDFILDTDGKQLTEMAVTSTGEASWLHSNVFRGSVPFATYDQNGLHFYLTDQVGTRRVQANFAGVVDEVVQVVRTVFVFS
jgi:YD repeat-containing protein